MGCQARTVIKGVEEITPLTKKEFDKKYASLGEYDFLHISMYGGNKAVFSHKVPNHGYVERPILTRAELASKLFQEETAMRVRDEERARAQMSSERRERPVLQETHPERLPITVTYSSGKDNRATSYSSTDTYSTSSADPDNTTRNIPIVYGTDSRERTSVTTPERSNRGFRRRVDDSGEDSGTATSSSTPVSATIQRDTSTPPGGGGGGRTTIRSSIL